MKVLIQTAHVHDGHNKANESDPSSHPPLGLIALCNIVMMALAEPMHCCKAASYACP